MIKATTKTWVSFVATIIYLVLLIGSAAPAKLGTQRNVGKFDYTPPSVAKAKSSDVAFALVRPSYAPDFGYTSVPPFVDFRNMMEADFEELLISRGYSLRGPFNSRDDMVYSDKEQSDLALMVELHVDVNQVTPRPWKIVFSLADNNNYIYQGTLVLSAKVNLTIAEATTGEKLWAKSILLPQREVGVASERHYADISGIPIADPGIHNPLTTALEGYYKIVMQTSWNHLEPIEVRSLKAQANEIKKKAVYTK